MDSLHSTFKNRIYNLTRWFQHWSKLQSVNLALEFFFFKYFATNLTFSSHCRKKHVPSDPGHYPTVRWRFFLASNIKIWLYCSGLFSYSVLGSIHQILNFSATLGIPNLKLKQLVLFLHCKLAYLSVAVNIM